MTRVVLPVPLTAQPMPDRESLEPAGFRRLIAEISRILGDSQRRTEVLETRTVIRDGIAKSPNTVGQFAIDTGKVYMAVGLDVADWTVLTEVSDGDKGDITVSGGGVVWTIDAGAIGTTKIADNAVTSAKIADNAVTFAKMNDIATARIIGRVTAATGDPEALTGTQATTLLDVFTSTLKGLAPASGGGTANFLRADGTWAAPPTPGSPALNDLTDVTIASAAEGQVLLRGATEFANKHHLTFTIGPFFNQNVAASSTSVLTPMFFTGATAVSRATTPFRPGRAGRVVGAFLMAQAARTAGTATLKVRVSGTDYTFASSSVNLNATNPQYNSAMVGYASGVSFDASAGLYAVVETNGSWAPNGDFAAYLVVQLEGF